MQMLMRKVFTNLLSVSVMSESDWHMLVTFRKQTVAS